MPPLTPRPTRRSLLLTGGSLGAGALLTACGYGPTAGTSEEAGGRGEAGGRTDRSFTDDRGTTVELPAAPERVVAFIGTAAALHDYGVECAGAFGPTADADGTPDAQAGDLDVTRPVRLGNARGEFGLDAYATPGPQLLVTAMFPEDVLWYVPDDSREQIERLAPTVGLTASSTTLRAAIDRHAELARALGGDLDAPAAADARDRFDAASEALRAAARDNPGLRVPAASAADDLLHASTHDAYADLAHVAELGLDLMTPDGVKTASSRTSAGRTPTATRPTSPCSTTAAAPSSRQRSPTARRGGDCPRSPRAGPSLALRNPLLPRRLRPVPEGTRRRRPRHGTRRLTAARLTKPAHERTRTP